MPKRKKSSSRKRKSPAIKLPLGVLITLVMISYTDWKKTRSTCFELENAERREE